MKKLSLLLLVCMVSMFAFASPYQSIDSSSVSPHPSEVMMNPLHLSGLPQEIARVLLSLRVL